MDSTTKTVKYTPERLPPEPTEEINEMDDLMARTIVENLILGIDPMTGRALDSSDSCSNKVVQEALRMVLKHCSLKSYKTQAQERTKKKARKKKNPATKTSGKQQNAQSEEYRRLVELCQQRKSILEMVNELGCSTDTICKMLKHL